MPRKKDSDPVMAKVASRFEKSGLSLHDLGVRMGYPAETARQSAWQFMRTGDPHISVLRRVAAALDIPIEELVSEKRKSRTD